MEHTRPAQCAEPYMHGGHDLYVPSVALSMWVVCSRACWMRDPLSALALALAGGDGYFIFTFMYSAYSPSDDNTGGEAVENMLLMGPWRKKFGMRLGMMDHTRRL